MRWGTKVERGEGEEGEEGCCCWGTGEALLKRAGDGAGDLNGWVLRSVVVVVVVGAEGSEDGKMLLYIEIMAKDCSRKISM